MRCGIKCINCGLKDVGKTNLKSQIVTSSLKFQFGISKGENAIWTKRRMK